MAEPTPRPQAPPSRVGADLPLRVVSALALAPLALGAAYLGGWWFFAFWLVAAVGVLWEWQGMVAGAQAARIVAAAGLALVASAFALALGYPLAASALVLAGVAVAAALAVEESRAWAGVGVLYAAAIVLPALALRADPAYGFAAIVLLFAVVWGTDIGAYFGGRLIGGPKLLPQVSPKKTWSGALVGAAVAIVAGALIGYAAGLRHLAALAGVCFVLSVVSQAGDLFESAVKRRFGAKDSSGLIPGHGGLMDRLDGFVAAALAAVLIGLVRGGLEAPSRGLLIW